MNVCLFIQGYTGFIPLERETEICLTLKSPSHNVVKMMLHVIMRQDDQNIFILD